MYFTSLVLSYLLYTGISVWVWFSFMVFNATFNNISAISWRSVLLVQETGGPGKKQRFAACH